MTSEPEDLLFALIEARDADNRGNCCANDSDGKADSSFVPAVKSGRRRAFGFPSYAENAESFFDFCAKRRNRALPGA
jgi:hypothetical protein